MQPGAGRCRPVQTGATRCSPVQPDMITLWRLKQDLKILNSSENSDFCLPNSDDDNIAIASSFFLLAVYYFKFATPFLFSAAVFSKTNQNQFGLEKFERNILLMTRITKQKIHKFTPDILKKNDDKQKKNKKKKWFHENFFGFFCAKNQMSA